MGAEQLTMQGRQRAEAAIEQALCRLDPGGEIGGTMLERYYPAWRTVRDIPGEEIEKVARSLQKEVRVMEALGEDKYFANLTPAQKLGLNRRAHDLAEMVVHGGGIDPHRPMLFTDFEEIRRSCVLAASPLPDGAEDVVFDLTGEDAPLDAAGHVAAYLHGKTDRDHAGQTALRRVVEARLADGYTIEDMKRAIDGRTAAGWDGTEPETVFGEQFDTWLARGLEIKTNEGGQNETAQG